MCRAGVVGRWAFCLTLAVVATATNGAALRRGGSPDPEFGTAGVTRTHFPGPLGVSGLARQPDGKLIVGCTTRQSVTVQSSQFVLVRYTPGGALDPTFGDGGIVQVDFDDETRLSARCTSVGVDPQGRILAAGRVYGGPNPFAVLIRCNPDGTLDNTFGVGGKVSTFAGSWAWWQDIAVLPGGGVVAVGTGSTSGKYEATVARFTSLGQPDPSFGSGGRLVVPFGSEAWANGVAVRADGSIVVCGQTLYRSDAALIQLRPDGSLDPAFGSGGKVLLDVAHYYDSFQWLVLQSDGKVLVAGETATYDDGQEIDHALLARFTATGQLDRSFGRNGVYRSWFGEEYRDLALQADGRPVVTADDWDGFSLLRFTRSGVPDHSFGKRGRVLAIRQEFNGYLGAVLVEPSGKIVAASGDRTGDEGADLFITRRFAR